MAFDWGGAAGGFASSTLSTGNPLLGLAGGLMGGFMGGKKSPGVDSILPRLDPKDMARTSTASLGNWGQKSSMVQSSAFDMGKKTTSDLIASGMDPVTAAKMGATRQSQALLGGQDSLLNSAMEMEKNAFDRYSGMAFERDNDRASYGAWQSQQPRGFQKFAPAIMETMMGLGINSDGSNWLEKEGLGGLLGGLFNKTPTGQTPGGTRARWNGSSWSTVLED
jgi:hypothetical protein